MCVLVSDLARHVGGVIFGCFAFRGVTACAVAPVPDGFDVLLIIEDPVTIEALQFVCPHIQFLRAGYPPARGKSSAFDERSNISWGTKKHPG